MGDMLSQAEIDALLNGGSVSESSSDTNTNTDADSDLSTQEVDALGEVGNISMGTSATTLYTLLGQKVMITTPQVTVHTWKEFTEKYDNTYVAVRVEYTEGLNGANLLVLKENDAKIITDLMMGGDGSNTSGEITDLHLSAVGEAMNQMIGSAATSMSSIFEKRVDISPPKAFVMNFEEDSESAFHPEDKLVKISFKMIIGELIDSEIMQLIPLPFAKSLVDSLIKANEEAEAVKQSEPMPSQPQQQNMQQPNPQQQNIQQPQQQNMQQQYPPPQYNEMQQGMGQQQYNGYSPGEQARSRDSVNVQPAQFQAFDDGMISLEKKNIGLIMDVPLEVTVELGRTRRLIKEILEFGPGSIIELDKLAGEPVDILVNGKVIAKGEVVVIDESFGVRITDIIHPSKRL